MTEAGNIVVKAALFALELEIFGQFWAVIAMSATSRSTIERTGRIVPDQRFLDRPSSR